MIVNTVVDSNDLEILQEIPPPPAVPDAPPSSSPEISSQDADFTGFFSNFMTVNVEATRVVAEAGDELEMDDNGNMGGEVHN